MREAFARQGWRVGNAPYNRRWNEVAGPCGAVIATARRIGWALVAWNAIKTHEGVILQLMINYDKTAKKVLYLILTLSNITRP